MSRDVAYRNGYLPLFAGAELVRRSGSLTQFPAESLIGTLPGPVVNPCAVYTAFGTQPPYIPGTGIAGLTSYTFFDATYRDFLASSPEQCNLLIGVLDTATSGGQLIPVAPDGSTIPDLLDPANWVLTLSDLTFGGAGYSVSSADENGVVTSWGSMTLSRTGLGPIVIDASGLTPGYPTVFDPSCSAFYVQNILAVGSVQDTSWYPPPGMYLPAGARAWVECLLGGPCVETP